MSLSCNLAQNARKHKEFLESLHELGVTIATGDREQQDSLRSLFRYQRLWLPLVHKFSREDLIPPPDVAWLWHCHRLSPLNYVNYIKDNFGEEAVVEAKPPFAFQIPDSPSYVSLAEATTRDIWKSMYSNEPFFLSESQKDSPLPALAGSPNDVQGESVKLLSGFDLLASTERQATFLWQVSGERFGDDDFLAEGVEKYIKFLKLKPKAAKSRTVLVPTYQIDLMWHTHILLSIGDYNKDCIAVMGRTLHHDDSLTDRSDGGVLDIAYKATVRLWKEEYDSEYMVCGGMYRGEPPEAYFCRDWKSWHDFSAGVNLDVAVQMGASSTVFLEFWVEPDSTTSKGLDAFIPVIASCKSDLSTCAPKKDYVLGRTTYYGTGYYHLETKEAHQILLIRVERNVRALESQIARAQGCCPRKREWIQAREAELEAVSNARDVLASRLKASCPGDVVVGHPSNPSFYDRDGAWLYPPHLFNCAGGACGGAVACGPSSCAGGSACAVGGLSGLGGGQCGGGGHGGGGYGGGGCGGGGCGGCGGCGG